MVNQHVNHLLKNLSTVYPSMPFLYKEIVPVNFRMLAKSIVAPSPVTEKDFNKRELQALNKVAKRAEFRVNNPLNTQASNEILKQLQDHWDSQKYPQYPQVNSMGVPNNNNNIANYAQDYSSDMIYNMAKDMTAKGIQYPDYNTDVDINSIGNNFAYRSIVDPNYALATTLGRAVLKDNKLADTYDFNKFRGKQTVTPKGDNDSIYLYLRNKLAPQYSNNMPINVNLAREKGEMYGR